MTGTEQLQLRADRRGTVLPVKVVPGASRDRIVGVLGSCLKVTVAAPPEKGKANAAVASLLAEALGVNQRAVSLVSGGSSPRKEFIVCGASAGDVREALKSL